MSKRCQEDLWPFLDHLAGWLMLVVGTGMLTTAVLAPAWHTTVQLSRHRDLMKVQTGTIVEQEAAYVRFQTALVDRDPVLLRRLACYQLRLKPAGTAILVPRTEPPSARMPTGFSTLRDGGVGAWLHRPVIGPDRPPLAGTDPLFDGIDSRGGLSAWIQGPARLAFIGCGVICVAVGLILPLGPKSENASHAHRFHRRFPSSD